MKKVRKERKGDEGTCLKLYIDFDSSSFTSHGSVLIKGEKEQERYIVFLSLRA